MIGKLRELIEVQEGMKSLNTSMKQLMDRLSQVEGKIDLMEKHAASVTARAEKTLLDFTALIKTPTSQVMEAASAIKEEAYEFKMLKSGIKDQILAVFKDELHKEILKNLEVLREDAVRYARSRDEIKSLSHAVGEAGGELRKFQDVAKLIKKEDFQLVNYAKKIEGMEGEKLRLLRKIDDLERMVAKIRRGVNR